MALQGNYNFKGIDIPSAYLMIKDITYNKSIQLQPFEITAPVLDDENMYRQVRALTEYLHAKTCG